MPTHEGSVDRLAKVTTTRIGLALLLVGTVAGACTSEIDPSHGRAPDLPFSDVAPSGSGGVSAVHTEPTFDCPFSEPKDGELCAVPGSTCEYGTSANKQCNAIATCLGGARPQWHLREPRTCPWEAQCPGLAIRDVEGKPCDLVAPDGGFSLDPPTAADELVCNGPDGVCACTTGLTGDGPRRWSCVFPTAECPTRRPLAGARCSGSRWCDYGSCTFKQGLLMTCENGRWVAGGKTCP